MTISKKFVALILIISMLVTLFAGCKPPEETDPTETEPAAAATGPKRPPDPGVIAPLAMESALPEDGIVWNMENIPDNLNDQIWATPLWADHDDYIERNVEFLGVDGKGYDGSRALALRQNGEYLWCDVYSLGMKRDETAVLNWRGGAMFWFWYDSTEIPCNMMVEMEINGAHIATGTPFYVLEEGQNMAKRGGKTQEAWDGAGYGRIPLSGGYRGWIGVPLTGYDVAMNKVAFVNFHLAYYGTQSVGSCIYFDNFCVTLPGVGPLGAELSETSAQLATSEKPAWDMENIPDNLLSTYWASMEGAGWDGFIRDNVRVLGAAGKGVNGSRALQIRQMGKYNGADVIALGITNDKSAFSDWSEGQYLWFWADTTGLSNDLRLDLFLDGQKPPVGTPYYGIDTRLKIQKAGTLTKAWDTATYGRMTIGAGYRGWVGLPLSAYGEVTDVLNITLHLAYDGKFEDAGRSVYFDEFWVLKEGELPGNATGASIATLRGGSHEMGLGAAAKLPKEVWSMEKLPSDPVGASWIYPEYKDDKDFRRNNVTYFRAGGKGWKGSTALGIRQNGAYSWADIYNLDLYRDSTAVRNWSNGKMLWFYADATDHTCEVRLDLAFDGVRPKVGGSCYLIPEGETAATEKVMKAAWDGANYGRIQLSTGFKGWVGIPLNQFKPALKGCNTMQIHVAYSGDDVKGKTLYLDSLWLTADMTCPNGVTVVPVSDKDTPATADRAAWDMENLPNNLITAGWASCDFSGEKDYKADNVQYLGAAGKGRNGSRALEIKFNGSYSWTDEFTVLMKNDATAATDWSGGKMLWLWVNAANLLADTELELWLGEKKIDASAGWYEVKDGKAVKGGELIKAWDGKGRIPVQAGYVGFLGLPLSGYGSISVVRNLTLHAAGSGVAAGRSLYLDELWVTGLNEIPKDAEDGRIAEEEVPDVPRDLPLVVWDMEALPDEPLTTAVAEVKFPDHAEFIPNNVTVSGTSGKGWQGSRALAFRYNGNYSWADIFLFHLAEDASAISDWAGGRMLWLWVDASAFGTGITVEPTVDGRGLKAGELVYTVKGDTARPTDTTFFSWDGATNARFRISAGYKGWIGLSFSAFVRTPVTAETIELHCGFDGDTGYQGKTLYLDQFLLTDEQTGPENCTITNEEPAPGSVNQPVWTMEGLPSDMASAFSTGYGKGTLGTYVDAVKATGKGFNGSTALGYEYLRYLQGGNGDNILQVDLSAAGAVTDWSDAGTVWFWVDASALQTALLMEVMVDWNRPKLGADCFFWDGAGTPRQSTLPAAWGDNTKEGRVQLTSGYKGWVGIPTAAYSGVNWSEVGDLVLYFEPYEDAASLPKTVYYDNFWITGAGETPDLSLAPGGSQPADPTDPTVPDDPTDPTDPTEPEGFTSDQGKAVWTMEGLPADLSQSIVTAWGRGTLGEYVDAVAAAGKGYNGSTALGYKYLQYVDGNNGDNILQISLGAALGANTNWSGEELLWFWVDASEMQTSLLLEVMLNWTRPAIGSTCYLWSGAGEPSESTMPAAWGGNTSDGRVKLPSKYKGWVGIPLSAYSGMSLSNVDTMILYFEPKDDAASLPKTVYFDDFWLTAANSVPDLSAVRGVKTAAPRTKPVPPAPDPILPAPEEPTEPEELTAPEEPAEPEELTAPEEPTEPEALTAPEEPTEPEALTAPEESPEPEAAEQSEPPATTEPAAPDDTAAGELP